MASDPYLYPLEEFKNYYYYYVSGHADEFKKYPTGSIDELGQPYDYGSIVHSSAYAFAKDKTKMTIVPKQVWTITDLLVAKDRVNLFLCIHVNSVAFMNIICSDY